MVHREFREIGEQIFLPDLSDLLVGSVLSLIRMA
jgi:hypothetical protein